MARTMQQQRCPGGGAATSSTSASATTTTRHGRRQASRAAVVLLAAACHVMAAAAALSIESSTSKASARSLLLGPTHPSGCVDLWIECAGWVVQDPNSCGSNAWMKGNCDRSCRFCTPDDAIRASATVVVSPQARKPAYQSSKIVVTGGGGSPSGIRNGPEQAVNYDIRTTDGACATTLTGSLTEAAGFTNQWWYVDLLTAFSVYKVEIYKAASDTGLINGAQVRVGSDTPGSRVWNGLTFATYAGTGLDTNTLCGTLNAAFADPSGLFSVACPAATAGRYVSVANYNGQALTLCEVMVYATPGTEFQVPTTAFTATSSTYRIDNIPAYRYTPPSTIEYGPTRAIDNIYTSFWSALGLCAVVLESLPQNNPDPLARPWWALDMGASIVVSKILVYRTDSVLTDEAASISGGEVRVGDYVPGGPGAASPNGLLNNAFCGVLDNARTENGVISLSCRLTPNPPTGRYLSIRALSGQQMTLCEVAVFAVPPTIDAPLQIGTGKTAGQSGNAGGPDFATARFPASLATDDRLETCAQIAASTNGPSWWSENLGAQYIVSTITIETFAACNDCSGPIIGPCPACVANTDGAEVRVGSTPPSAGGASSNTLCGVLRYAKHAYGGAITVTCPPGTTGRFVTVAQPSGGEMTICEALVYARPGPSPAATCMDVWPTTPTSGCSQWTADCSWNPWMVTHCARSCGFC